MNIVAHVTMDIHYSLIHTHWHCAFSLHSNFHTQFVCRECFIGLSCGCDILNELQGHSSLGLHEFNRNYNSTQTMFVGNSYLLVSIVEGINSIFINIHLHRNVWNPGPFPENVEPSLSSAGSLPNDSSESNNSSSIRYVSLTNERVEMNESLDQFSERFHNLHSPNMSLWSFCGIA